MDYIITATTAKLTDEQREAIRACAGQPVRIADEATNQVYYLLNEETFAHLRGLQAGLDEACRERLRQLIGEGIRSPDVAADVVFSSMRRTAQDLVRRGA